MSKRPAYTASHFLSTRSSELGCLFQDTSVFKQVVSLYNGADGFGFHFRKMVMNQASGGNDTCDCRVELFFRLAFQRSSVLTWFKTLLGPAFRMHMGIYLDIIFASVYLTLVIIIFCSLGPHLTAKQDD